MKTFGFATEQEIEFLNGLGKWHTSPHEPSKMVKLRGYLRSLNGRSNWGDIARHQVERHCLALIEREEVLAEFSA